jgi:hypothetical protein
MIIGMKMRYGVTEIDQNTVGLSSRPFLDWAEKSGNFLDLFQIFCIVYLAFPHCLSGLGLLYFFF